MPASRHHLHQHIISTRATLRIVPLANLTHADCITSLEGPPILLGLQYQIKEEPLAWASTNTSIVHNAGIRSPGAQHQQRTCQQTGKKRSTHTIAREHVCVCACLWLCMCICVCLCVIVYMCVSMCMCICVRVCVGMCVCVFAVVHVYVCVWHTVPDGCVLHPGPSIFLMIQITALESARWGGKPHTDKKTSAKNKCSYK